MSESPTFPLPEIPVHLGLGATAVPQEPFDGTMEWYDRYVAATVDDGHEGRLVSMASFDEPWAMWEMHPHGEELVVCTAGTITVHQEIDGGTQTVTLGVGDAVVNPPGVWHTADVDAPCTVLFITPGAGTEHRPR
ncbi:MAG: cupin domain-containing protein [Acidimicrobiales bacterium]|jgi:quercetin dioxygenase-like cupin family protein|nr:cupin domain-containing protein [Acidimicrobiales bacterium]